MSVPITPLSGNGKFSIYPVAGGSARAVPGTVPEDEIIHWSADGRSVLIRRSWEVPARIECLDLSTGKRVLFKKLAPPSRAGGETILVIQERMPPGTAEVMQFHRRSRQVFYVLRGKLTMENESASVAIPAWQLSVEA